MSKTRITARDRRLAAIRRFLSRNAGLAYDAVQLQAEVWAATGIKVATATVRKDMDYIEHTKPQMYARLGADIVRVGY